MILFLAAYLIHGTKRGSRRCGESSAEGEFLGPRMFLMVVATAGRVSGWEINAEGAASLFFRDRLSFSSALAVDPIPGVDRPPVWMISRGSRQGKEETAEYIEVKTRGEVHKETRIPGSKPGEPGAAAWMA